MVDGSAYASLAQPFLFGHDHGSTEWHDVGLWRRRGQWSRCCGSVGVSWESINVPRLDFLLGPRLMEYPSPHHHLSHHLLPSSPPSRSISSSKSCNQTTTPSTGQDQTLNTNNSNPPPFKMQIASKLILAVVVACGAVLSAALPAPEPQLLPSGDKGDPPSGRRSVTATA